ncbi:hypothetical protein FSY45_07520 [Comamonas sp. Z1]|uniref:hypothetical protein n=1 Tax=Comamonas sp. Z1 TaxID=2601246 RepID=UPI0011E6DE1E|nr:hypothetical protein [Comamonas sp. Z1]TYK76480.1 hypothetical protein FSY45_07520 [Comamonas sp. Z1]
MDLLKGAKEAELVWQDIVNDIYHRRSKFERIIPLTQRDVLLESFDAWDREFSGSLENAKKIRNDIEDSFDDIKKNEAEKWHRKIEVMKLSLAQSRAEMNRKFELMEQRISEAKNSKDMG